ncbi:hypothetical protein BGW38_004612 [Lunasporangiospora selenospora]|uniref:Uncharacterized protein n=1 Tax=Lunasporangiospora selenospora TaxID=979761 RepID=A0A9P6FPH0_9FUNG|nr:hypothetical protein BGW38_004612 [Lunasporangiospora selenospora]
MQDSNTGEMLLHCSNPLKIPQHQQIDIPSDHHPKDRTLDQHGPSPDQTQHPSPRRKPTTPRTNNSSPIQQPATASPPSSSFARTSFWNRYRGRILASLRIIKRATLLFCMGLFINGLELINTSGEDVWIRIPGVLQRIGFSFMILALLLIWSPLRPKSGALEQSHSQISRIGLPLFCTSLWFVLTYGVQSTATIPIPGCDKPPTFPAGDLNSGVALFNQRLTPPQCTAQAYLDALLFTRAHDPNYPMVDAEGTIGTLMSIMTTWLGWVIGVLIMDHQRLQKTMTKRLTEQHDAGQAHDPISAEERSDIASPSSVRALVGPLNESDVSSSSLQEQLTRQQRTNLLASLGQWFMIGVCVMYAGAMLGWFLPISKPLWTPSFTLYTGGVSTTTLCILMYIYDLPSDPMQPRVPEGHVTRGPFYEILNDLWMVLQKMAKVSSQAITSFLICYGCNPTLIYMLSEVVMTVLRRIPVNGGEEWIQSAWAYLFFNSFYRFMSPAWASIFFSLVYILLFAPLMFFLYRRGLFLRV